MYQRYDKKLRIYGRKVLMLGSFFFTLAAQAEASGNVGSGSNGLLAEIVNALQSGGPIGFAALCLLALYLVAKAYIKARDDKDAVLMAWNTESKHLIQESSESSGKTADALGTLIPIVAKNDNRLFRIAERLSRIEEKLGAKPHSSGDDDTNEP